MGSLRTFEIELSEKSEERNKIMGLRAESELPVDEGSKLLESWPRCQRIVKEP